MLPASLIDVIRPVFVRVQLTASPWLPKPGASAMRPVLRPVTSISLASVNGLMKPGAIARTLSPIGRRSTAPHRLQKRPLQSRTLRVGAPLRAKACMMCTTPSPHSHAQPSIALVSTQTVSSCCG